MAERHEIVFSGAIAGGGSMGGGGIAGEDDGMKSEFEKNRKAIKEHTSGFFKKIGIDLTWKSMLKQSQIFTSTLGSFFSIVGGFIDIVLTPFIPIIIPVIKLVAKLMPTAMTIAKWVGKGVDFVVKWVGKFFTGLNNLTGGWLGKIMKPIGSIILMLGTIIGLLATTKMGRGLIGKGARGLFGGPTGRTGPSGGFAPTGAGILRRGYGASSLAGNMGGRSGMLMKGGGALGAVGGGISMIGGVQKMRQGNMKGGGLQTAGGAAMMAGGAMMMTGVGAPVGAALMVGGLLASAIGASMEKVVENTDPRNAQQLTIRTNMQEAELEHGLAKHREAIASGVELEVGLGETL